MNTSDKPGAPTVAQVAAAGNAALFDDHQQHYADERRAMQLVAGLALIAAVSVIGLAVAAFADQLTGLDVVVRLLGRIRGIE